MFDRAGRGNLPGQFETLSRIEDVPREDRFSENWDEIIEELCDAIRSILSVTHGRSYDMNTSANEGNKVGTPENNSLLVKRLGEEWIVEDQLGDTLGSATDREGAIELARAAKQLGKGSSISIHGEDGEQEKTIDA